MRELIAAASLVLAASCASTPPIQGSIPVELVQGEMVELWGVSARQTTDGVAVSGNAQRRLTPNRPLNEHLHAEALGAGGQLLETRDVAWNSIVSLRTRKSASFRTEFGRDVSGEVASVRMIVKSGWPHVTND